MTLVELQHKFAPGKWPQFLSLEISEHICRLAMKINPEIHWLEGHFPEQPIVAGVVQTHWAAELGKAIFPLGENFQRIDNLKFQTAILPGQDVNLQLHYLPDAQAVKFSYHCADTLCSEGKLVFFPENQKHG